jgi:hypothetical protein
MGFALGACGGGSTSGALSTRSSTLGTNAAGTRTADTATRELPTRAAETQTVTTAVTTAETLTETATTAFTTTTAVTTTEPGPTTTRQHVIGTTATTTVTFSEATTAETDSGTSWGWIALGLSLGLAALGIILWALHRRKAGAQAWGRTTADLNRRALVALDDVVAQGSVVTGKIEALASEARALESSAPDDASRAAAANVRSRLDELASTMQSDRALRLGSPPPTNEQLTYSTAVIRQQAEQLQGVLRPPAAV